MSFLNARGAGIGRDFALRFVFYWEWIPSYIEQLSRPSQGLEGPWSWGFCECVGRKTHWGGRCWLDSQCEPHQLQPCQMWLKIEMAVRFFHLPGPLWVRN